jgi:hypothetical protein
MVFEEGNRQLRSLRVLFETRPSKHTTLEEGCPHRNTTKIQHFKAMRPVERSDSNGRSSYASGCIRPGAAQRSHEHCSGGCSNDFPASTFLLRWLSLMTCSFPMLTVHDPRSSPWASSSTTTPLSDPRGDDTPFQIEACNCEVSCREISQHCIRFVRCGPSCRTTEQRVHAVDNHCVIHTVTLVGAAVSVSQSSNR